MLDWTAPLELLGDISSRPDMVSLRLSENMGDSGIGPVKGTARSPVQLRYSN